MPRLLSQSPKKIKRKGRKQCPHYEVRRRVGEIRISKMLSGAWPKWEKIGKGSFPSKISSRLIPVKSFLVYLLNEGNFVYPEIHLPMFSE